MLNFFHTPYLTIIEPKIARQLIKKSFKSALGYFLFFYLLIGGISGYLQMRTNVPQTINHMHIVLQSLKQNYPSDLDLSFENNQLYPSIATTAAITIPLNQTVYGKSNLLIIDPNTNAETIEYKDTLFLLTQNAFSVLTNPTTQNYTLAPYSQLNLNQTLESSDITQSATMLLQSLEQLRPYLLPTTIAISTLALIIGRLIYLAIYTLLTQLLGQLLNRKHPYKQYFILGLHTIVIAEIINQIQITALNQSYPLIFTLSFLGLTLVHTLNLVENTQKPTAT